MAGPDLISRLTAPIVRFIRLQAAGGVVLLAATVVALVVANTPLAEDYARLWSTRFTVSVGGASLSYPAWYWINDGLMTIFFFVIGLEIKRELVAGELRDRRNVALPLIAAIGGAVIPIAIYLIMQPSLPARAGWAVPMATDIAFVVGCLAILGSRAPRSLVVFMLSLAIIDDVIAVIVIAVAFSAAIDLAWLACAVGGLAVIWGLRQVGVRTIPIYAIVGSVVWFCTLESGIHPTVAGVLLGLMTPIQPATSQAELEDTMQTTLERLRDAEAPTDERHHAVFTTVDAAVQSVSPLERLERALHGWVAFAIMPLFALANAGLPLHVDTLLDPAAIATALALAVGKPVGIAGSAAIAIRLGVARRPEGVSWTALVGAAWLGGIGFTMALFIASLSLDGAVLVAAKTGIFVGSALSAVGGMVLLLRAARR